MKNSLKIMHEQLDLHMGTPVKVKWCDYDYFKYPWHFHSEYEIVYIVKSTGTRFAGNSIEPYSDGDLVLFGSFLPHMYRSDEMYYQGMPENRVHAVIVQFSQDFFNHAFHNYPEFNKIMQLLKNAKYGISFNKNANETIRKRILGLLKLNGLNRLLECIKILSLMSKSNEKRILGDDSFDNQPLNYSDTRLMKVLALLNREYNKPLHLKTIAEISGMNTSAFCRYFKERTAKSLTQYINELRVGYACKLLLNGTMTISQICFECGFNNLSNFNRHFKRISKYTPTDYQKEFGKPV